MTLCKPLATNNEEFQVVMLAEARDSTGSSMTEMPGTPSAKQPTGDETPITLGLAIRRTRLVTFTISMVVFIAGLTLFFRHGVALTYFDSRDKNATQQTKLLDDYNSYSGNVASVFAKPIELFVTVAVQVIVLRFMADTFTRPDMSWKISALTLLLGAGVGYLIGNGFHALNVQLRPQRMDTMMTDKDLFLQSDFLVDDVISSFNTSVPEVQSGNAVVNTLLQSAVVPKLFRAATHCGWTGDGEGGAGSGAANDVKEAFVNLGFMQREWHGQVLQRAPASDTLRIVVNPTNTSANNHVNSSNLPMNASIAADLFYHAITLSTDFFPWGQPFAFANRTDMIRRYPVNDTKPHTFQARVATLYGLLPPNNTVNASDDAVQKAWFLRESAAAMSRQFAFATRTKQSDLVMAFSHTQLTPTIAFDAVTFAVEIDPMLLATVASPNNATRYTVLDQRRNCPRTGRCMIEKTSYGVTDLVYDPPAQVFAFAPCGDKRGNEVLRLKFTRQNGTLVETGLLCYADTFIGALRESMLVVSIGKRLVADALEQNVTATLNGTTKFDNASATVTNLRKIYTFTVGRLSWQFTDLAKAYHARCGAVDDKETACQGLELALSTSLDVTERRTADQRVVVGAPYLPLDLISTPDGPLGLTRTNLVILDEPPRPSNASALYKVLAGDVLLPHNIGRVQWGADCSRVNCGSL